MDADRRKRLGAYYTPDEVVRSLVAWAVHSPKDRMLDPSCGDGRFLARHSNSLGIEHDEKTAAAARVANAGRDVQVADFFAWASSTAQRFDCAAGNPPFIRYQRFSGVIREAALRLCAGHGARFTGLTSSWAPFLVATATLLKPAGRMAFVVPAEIGHAPYARPLVEYLASRFQRVQIVAVLDKMFSGLSEDCWLLYADGFGGVTDRILLTQLDSFHHSQQPPAHTTEVRLPELEEWNWRLRPFLMPASSREVYRQLSASGARLGDIAHVGIGYVTGANDFFHMRPSEASRLRIPVRHLRTSVRNGRSLSEGHITPAVVTRWHQSDEPVLLLALEKQEKLGKNVLRYLSSPEAKEAQATYKCRNREPWYCVPDVTVPHAFLSYMSGRTPVLAENLAGCVAPNTLHVVKLKAPKKGRDLLQKWRSPVTELSCEVEGHPLGGGMLKLEPREAVRVVLDGDHLAPDLIEEIRRGTAAMRRWRHLSEPPAKNDALDD